MLSGLKGRLNTVARTQGAKPAGKPQPKDKPTK